MTDFMLFTFAGVLVFGAWIWQVVKSDLEDSSNNREVYKPIRKLANGQRFTKAYIDSGEFSSTGFSATFMLIFSKEHISITVSGYAILSDDGVLMPRITDNWCETYDRQLTSDEIDMVFNYVMVHDRDFIEQLETCQPRKNLS